MAANPVSYDTLFSIKSENDFNETALAVFRYQYAQNEVYRDFVNYLKTDPNSIEHHLQIPFLPIQFFKTHRVISSNKPVQTTFYSSGTTQTELSQHHIVDLEVYNQSLLHGFELAFGPVDSYSIFALLPSYHQNKNSSLLYMVDKLIQQSGNAGGFFLENHQELLEAITLQKKFKKVMLIGVSYALLDLVESKPDLSGCVIIETGGMKGRRKEMTKKDLHTALKTGLNVPAIGSEYGMTELLSQAWSKGDGLFNCPPWMKIVTREYNDPLELITEKTGGINVIDLANIHSCSFIATQDLGIVRGNQFEIAGRFDNADLRGCNLLIG
ncbi:MAG: acyl transferase [Crocinitomicaceae bacterium]|nr:acyl transferase [Crocinitomicaceae bacterium]